MYSPAATITHKAVNTGPLNILCMDTHERYQSNLCKTGHNFYSLYHKQQKRWDNRYNEPPDNYHLILNPSGDVQLHNGVVFDLVLSQNKFGQFQTLQKIAKQIHAPLVSIEHTLPHDKMPTKKVEAARNMRGDYNIYLSEYSRGIWQSEGTLIHNAVDTDFFCPADKEVSTIKSQHAFSVVNEWKTRDAFCGYNLWKDIVRDDIPTYVRGDNPGWTFPASSLELLRDEYRSSRLFLNTSLVSTCPTTVLEAAACGVPIVTTATTMLPEIIQNGYNGFISNDVDELRKYVKLLLNDSNLAEELGANARKTMIEKFSIESFIEKWNVLFDDTRNFVFKG